MSGRSERPDSTRFSFGENWLKYLEEMPSSAPAQMAAYVADWLGADLSGRRMADVGSGQGLTSLCAYQAGAQIVSFDVDAASVEATRQLWDRAGRPDTWSVVQGSILDPTFVGSLGSFDIVASWGVLHHTGEMWRALDAAAALVRPGGALWIALYHRTYHSRRSLRLKRAYNALPNPGQAAFRGVYAGAKLTKHLLIHQNLTALRQYGNERGMTWRRDIADWLGGLPYEVASPGDVLARLQSQGFNLVRLHDALGEGANDVYLFRRQ